jgi:hypothetical protein
LIQEVPRKTARYSPWRAVGLEGRASLPGLFYDGQDGPNPENAGAIFRMPMGRYTELHEQIPVSRMARMKMQEPFPAMSKRRRLPA